MSFFEPKLFDAITNGDVDNLRDFLKCGLSADYAFKNPRDLVYLGKTLVEVAVSYGQLEIIRLLNKHNCNPSLTMVVDVGLDNKIKLKPYLDDQRLKRTCIYPCIVQGHLDMTRLLVSAGFDVNIQDERGCTPLWHAVDLSNYQMTKAITSSPLCDVNIEDHTHLSPLHVIALKDYADVRIASLLIRRGAHIDALTSRGCTPLILACKSDRYDLVRLLLLNGANPNHCGYNGHTPISAVLENCKDSFILELLMKAGARIDLVDVRKCFKDKLPLLKTCPGVVDLLKLCASTPTDLKMLCCLRIRKALFQGKSGIHLLSKVQTLPLPNIVKEFLMLNYLS